MFCICASAFYKWHSKSSRLAEQVFVAVCRLTTTWNLEEGRRWGKKKWKGGTKRERGCKYQWISISSKSFKNLLSSAVIKHQKYDGGKWIEGRMVHVETEVDMTALTAPDHNKKITQMLKDEWLDERKPFSASSEHTHAKSFACFWLATLKPLETDSTD